jgi:hypothetical protein
MRGPSYESLVKSASAHPVAVLIPGEDSCHALIIKPLDEAPSFIVLKNIARSDLERFQRSSATSQTRGSASESENDLNDRGIGIDKQKRRSTVIQMLAKMWKAVVKPVIEYLGMDVSHFLNYT